MPRITRHWRQRLAEASGPAYLALVDCIAEDARSGRLSPGDRLPPLREMATDLDLNYSTIARGLAEARKRGLVDSRVGSGTFVRGPAPAMALRDGNSADMTMNLPPEPDDANLVARLRASAAAALGEADPYALLRYQDFGGSPRERELGAQWMKPRFPEARAERVLVAPGAHAVLHALVSQLARPGDTICVEALTYPGIKAIAAQLGVRLLPLADDGAPLPAAFRDACKSAQPKALYLNPTLNNPTTRTILRSRREALAEIALAYSVPIIEDDAYGRLVRTAPPAFASLAPELTWYLTGLSKCVGAGLRTAYVHAPGQRQMQRLAGTLRATTVMASPVTTAIASRWIEDGTADALIDAVRDEANRRQRIAETELAAQRYVPRADSFHLWLPLPKTVEAGELAGWLRERGVPAVAAVAFSTGTEPPNALRLCLGGQLTREQCAAGLHLVAEALAHPVVMQGGYL
ncbi:PLP-dependent aminotransferase family protein [Derxia gummosa]|uniref:PLP-dependent aminotransferase family protein n=1 Tax=Derxia gummosa DSM 723 TaxID=1121388 RepID=A0A8B6X4Q9_9BURK|nr:PLP-dependent aminotransferase family protein [Derxia gummosa]